MCGRYSLVFIDDLGNRFRVFNPMIGSRSRFNIAPGNEMPVIIREEKNEIVMMKWGLVPHRTLDITTVQRPINARAETLSEKPTFKELLQNRRCLVPASGFFEWKKEGKKKIPEKVIDSGIEVGLIEQVNGKWICAMVSHEINAIDSAG